MKRLALYLIAALACADILGAAWLWASWQDRQAAMAAGPVRERLANVPMPRKVVANDRSDFARTRPAPAGGR